MHVGGCESNMNEVLDAVGFIKDDEEENDKKMFHTEKIKESSGNNWRQQEYGFIIPSLIPLKQKGLEVVDTGDVNTRTSTQKQWDTDPIFTEHWVYVVLQAATEIVVFTQLYLGEKKKRST